MGSELDRTRCEFRRGTQTTESSKLYRLQVNPNGDSSKSLANNGCSCMFRHELFGQFTLAETLLFGWTARPGAATGLPLYNTEGSDVPTHMA